MANNINLGTNNFNVIDANSDGPATGDINSHVITVNGYWLGQIRNADQFLNTRNYLCQVGNYANCGGVASDWSEDIDRLISNGLINP